MASGGYVGNIGNGKISIISCKFGGSVVSTQSICAGFVGQPTWESSSAIEATLVVIKDSEILSGTIIRNVAGGEVAAFSGQNTDRDYAANGNVFNGILQTNGNAYKEGTEATVVNYNNVCNSEEFTINDDGTISYNGETLLEKIYVTQYVIDDYIYNGNYYGGYNWNIETIKASKITKNSQIEGLTKITNLKNVVSSSDTPVGLQTLDDSHVGEIYNGTYYFDARTKSWGHYMLNGTYDSTTKTAINPTSLNIKISIVIYDSTGSLLGVVSGVNLSYSVATSQ